MVSENIKLPIIEPEMSKSQQAPRDMIDVSIQHEDMVEHKYMEDISEKHIDLEDQQQDKTKAIASHHRTRS